MDLETNMRIEVENFVADKLKELGWPKSKEKVVIEEYVEFVMEAQPQSSASDEEKQLKVLSEKMDGRLKVFLSPVYGTFRPEVIAKMVNLCHIDISGSGIDARLFIDTISLCSTIQKLVMKDCKQFTEYQLVELCRNLPRLLYLNALRSTPIMCVSAYQIITTWRVIEVLKVEPKMPEEDKRNWSQLSSMFLTVDFGPVIKELVGRK